jgi:capsular exopolysaccharide synthesis family protein
MPLNNYIFPIIKYWWLITVCVVVASLSSLIVVILQPPTYRAQATLLVGRAVFEANPNGTDLYLGQQLAMYYANLGLRNEIRQATMQVLGLQGLPEYTILPVPNSQLLEITVVDTYPARAQAVANELATQLIDSSPTSDPTRTGERQAFINEQITYLEAKITETLSELERAERVLSETNSAREIEDAQREVDALQEKLAQLQSNYTSLLSNSEQGAANTLSLIEPASLPIDPIGPNSLVIVVLSAMVAMMLSTGAAYVLEFLDDTFKSTEEIIHLLKRPVLANIPQMKSKKNPSTPVEKTVWERIGNRLGFDRDHFEPSGGNPTVDKSAYIYTSVYPRSSVADEFRTLRINLDFAGVDLSLRTILITSPDAAEGKTSVATNLAIVMAQGGKKVILVDTDFRKPSVDRHFQLANEKGLSYIIKGDISIEEAQQSVDIESLSVITTGITPPNPVDLLSSHRIDQVLANLRNICDVVIIDGPPLIFPDALALAAKVDSVVMVIRHSITRKTNAQLRLKQLEQVGARVLGFVLNEIPGKGMAQYGGYKDYYRHVDKVEE